MKKIIAAFLLVLAMVFSVPAQAQSELDLNRDVKEKFVPVSNFYVGRVVGIKTYLSIRERPSVNSREIMRIPNGAKLTLLASGDPNWFYVTSVKFNSGEYYDVSGYVSARYVQI